LSGPAEQIAHLGRELFDLKKKKADLEGQVEDTNKAILEIAQRKLPKAMEDAGIAKITLEGLGLIYLSNEFYVNVNKDDRDALYKWMRDKGHGDLVQSYVFPQTLTAFCKEQMERNVSLPEVVKVSHIPTAKTRKS
jgi:hypothetical protein